MSQFPATLSMSIDGQCPPSQMIAWAFGGIELGLSVRNMSGILSIISVE
jgi:hypothetical protein